MVDHSPYLVRYLWGQHPLEWVVLHWVGVMDELGITIRRHLGVCFLILQGYEWFQLLQFGMTLSSSVYGALFYLIIGAHGIHILVALTAMVYAINFFKKEEFENQIPEKTLPIQILWYFVVGIWPLLYIIVYLI